MTREEQILKIAVAIWRSEYSWSTQKQRSVKFNKIAERDQEKYQYQAEAALTAIGL